MKVNVDNLIVESKMESLILAVELAAILKMTSPTWEKNFKGLMTPMGLHKLLTRVFNLYITHFFFLDMSNVFTAFSRVYG